MRAYFFEREELERLRELDRPREPDEREREPDEPLDLRRDFAAVVRLRDLAPELRVPRAGFARRDELFADVFFAEVFFAERFEAPFVSPDLPRCLLTTRAASSSARPSLAPRLRADCLILAYCR
ncbi:MAG TPA: hypothetical protein VFZ09_06170 [Archangium sp.]|uniref:hypothetical protein n=1 Tax=Archangium sp. TaxID=1872627 RepID=UPI002E347144|nr:hypothetical protein [Archangium sp.]HEX5745808.1 hypothetical protein [Archangium sp.]